MRNSSVQKNISPAKESKASSSPSSRKKARPSPIKISRSMPIREEKEIAQVLSKLFAYSPTAKNAPQSAPLICVKEQKPESLRIEIPARIKNNENSNFRFFTPPPHPRKKNNKSRQNGLLKKSISSHSLSKP